MLEHFKNLELLGDLSTELEKLESTLSTIQALKDGAYDADDVLNEFATEALRRKIEREKGVKGQVSSFFSVRNRLIFRMKMAHKLKNVRDKLEAISMERLKFHLREGVINMEVLDIESRQTSSIVNESEIYGRGEEKEKIIEVLLTDVSNQENLSIYAVWGMVGLGKTILAQLVYNDVRVERHFEMRIWICVSNDFHIRRLMKAIIESIYGNVCSLSELDSQQQCLQEKLHGRRFLLVLDDVWNEYHDKWDDLKATLRCGASGSMVIVTTQIEKVAIMMATLPIHHMGCLSKADSWSLFKGRAFGMGRVKENLELESIGKEIVKKCRGIPLAIKALGSLMSLKNRKSEWLFVKESKIWDLLEGENSILHALRLSYHHLLPYLKQCFAYCCVFPKDHTLEMDTLIQLWLANGVIPSRGLLNLHDVGQDIFNELVWRSFFQDVREDVLGNITCKMHDFMHDLAQFIMKLECSTVKSEVLKLDYCSSLRELPNGMKHMKNLTYLGLTDCHSLTRMPKEMGQLTCLRSLSLFIAGKDDGYQINELKWLNLRGALCLKGLDNVTNLMDAKNANLIGKENLNTVSLVWRRDDTSNIPAHVKDVLDGLQPHSNLKKLSIQHYRGSKFPTWMEDLLLQNLVEISLEDCERCEHLPPLGKLSFLKDLFIRSMAVVKYLWDARMRHRSVISFPSLERLELFRMTNLEEWRTVNGREIFPRLSTLDINYCPKLVEFRSVMNLTSPSSFKFGGFHGSTVLPDNLLQNHKMLTSLSISGLHNHKSLTIGLKYLSALKSLTLEFCYGLETLHGVQNLRSLEHLHIWARKRLSSLPKQMGSLTSLSHLTIWFCPNLMSVPEELQNLTALKSLKIAGCPNLERRCKKHRGEDWHKIAHIPDIQIYPGRVQSWDSCGMLRKLKFC
ncbi:hypothetical protein ACB094_07G118000 [Castanea mollissima]